MIIYGIGTANLKAFQSKTVTCPECDTKGMMEFSFVSRHVHVFWIPLFPVGKKGVSKCLHCKHTMEGKEMPQDVKMEYTNYKSEVRAPIWQFVGLAIISMLIVWGVYDIEQTTERELEYITAPMIGDVYEFKIDAGSYTSIRVEEVKGDSVYVSENEYEINLSSSIGDIDKDENYMDVTYSISIDDLRKMYEDEDIYGVRRK